MKIDWGKYSVVSFYMSNIPAEVRLYQQKVFERFGCPLQQVHISIDGPMQESMVIGTAYEQWVEQHKDIKEGFLFFDIDCIPLSKEALEYYVKEIQAGKLIGPAQRSNHIENNKHVFAAPCALGFSSDLYKNLKDYGSGGSLFKPTGRGDTCEEFTFALEECGCEDVLNILRPTHVEKLIWPLEKQEELEYGEGTTYGIWETVKPTEEERKQGFKDKTLGLGYIYHAFNSRHGGTSSRFVDKCREVLGYGKQPMFTVVMPVGRDLFVAEKAIKSICEQDYKGVIQILVVLDRPFEIDTWDNTNEDKSSLAFLTQGYANIDIDVMELPYNSYSKLLNSTGGVPRCIGSALALGRYVCFLDDDNEFKPNHLSSLKETIEKTNANFIYSYRDFYTPEGKFYMQDDFESLGPDTGISAKFGGLIDTNCMCIKKSDLWGIFGGWLSPLREEDRWIVRLGKALGARFACTGKFTVRYKLPEMVFNNSNFWECRKNYLKGKKNG